MHNHENHTVLDFRMRIVSILCAILCIFLVVTVLIEWIFGLKNWSSFGEDFVPMAEITAILFLFYSVTSILLSFGVRTKFWRSGIVLINLIALFVSIITLVDIFTNYQWNLSNFFQQEYGNINSIVTGKMSNITAICFILVSISQLLILNNKKQLSVYCSLFILFTAYLILVGYAYDAPFFYGNGQIPMAWPTSFAFILISIGLIYAVGKDYAPISYFIGKSTRALLLRKLMPIVFIVMVIQNMVDIYFSNERSSNSAFADGFIDIAIMIIVGAFISIVSIGIGSRIDNYITEQKKTNAKLKNIAWQQSHKIRGPLTSILGIIGVINLGTTTEEKMNLLASLDDAAKELDMTIHSIVEETQH